MGCPCIIMRRSSSGRPANLQTSNGPRTKRGRIADSPRIDFCSHDIWSAARETPPDFAKIRIWSESPVLQSGQRRGLRSRLLSIEFLAGRVFLYASHVQEPKRARPTL